MSRRRFTTSSMSPNPIDEIMKWLSRNSAFSESNRNSERPVSDPTQEIVDSAEHRWAEARGPRPISFDERN